MSEKNNLRKLLEKEKTKIFFSLPCQLHTLFLPWFRFQMKWHIQRLFHKHKIEKELSQYPQTLRAALQMACHLYRLSPLFRGPHCDFLKSFRSPPMVALMHQYGDSFTSSLLQAMMDDISVFQDALQASKKLQQRSNFYHSPKFQELYNTISHKFLAASNQRDALYKFSSECAVIFDKLLANPSLLDQYLSFFTEAAQEAAILKIFETTSLICVNVGTSKAYENFLKYCKKFYARPQFPQTLAVADIIMNFQNPELVQQTFAWASASVLSLDLVEKVFLNGETLLKIQSQDPNYPAVSFQKFLHYVQKKEANMLKINSEEERGFYIKKAMEFFLEQ